MTEHLFDWIISAVFLATEPNEISYPAFSAPAFTFVSKLSVKRHPATLIIRLVLWTRGGSA